MNAIQTKIFNEQLSKLRFEIAQCEEIRTLTHLNTSLTEEELIDEIDYYTNYITECKKELATLEAFL